MKDPHKALEAIERIVGDDWGLDMEWVGCGLDKKVRRPISRLREAGRKVILIYQIAHAEGSCTGHPEWEDLKYEILTKAEE